MEQLYNVTFTPAVRRFGELQHLVPGSRDNGWISYIVTQDVLDALREFESEIKFHRMIAEAEVALLTPDITFQASNDVGVSSVLYTYTGRLGDTLIHTAALHQLRKNYPNRQFHLCTRFYTAPLWLNNGDVEVLRILNLPAFLDEDLRGYDEVLFPKNVSRVGKGSGMNIYTLMEQEIGCEIEVKRPYVHISGADHLQMEMVFNIKQYGDRTIYIQPQSMEVERTPTNWIQWLQHLSKAFPHYKLLVAVDDKTEAYFRYRLGTITNIIYLPIGGSQTVGSILTPKGALVCLKRASLVIAPDSFAMHASAMYDIPCLALWNFNPPNSMIIPTPEERCSTYSNVIPLDMQISSEELIEWAMKAIQY